jgi:hypothetical protein
MITLRRLDEADAKEGVLSINGDPIFDPPNHTCYSHFIPPLTVTNRLEGGSFNYVSVYYDGARGVAQLAASVRAASTAAMAGGSGGSP